MSELSLKGSVRVWAEIKKMLADFGDAQFSADRSVVEHWERLLVTEMADELHAALPEIQRQIEAIDRAKFVSRDLLNLEINI